MEEYYSGKDVTRAPEQGPAGPQPSQRCCVDNPLPLVALAPLTLSWFRLLACALVYGGKVICISGKGDPSNLVNHAFGEVEITNSCISVWSKQELLDDSPEGVQQSEDALAVLEAVPPRDLHLI